ncbi:MAG: iron (III) ABC transporter ATP-binding protein (hemV-1) [Ignavibacteria bacterium]|nr:MAG: iron (III) ABC transporter ATP-binding protein (hemV-1) [Ignavibacteria bacterium]KAF0160932.1 MAG: iron (III) ABC transporter ATP-binding protein (hemV-1) [Ignavibacteria bacterium]
MQQKNGEGFKLSIENFVVSEGEFISIIGPNGCGKSTLLKLIAGLLGATEGTIEVFGHKSRKENFKHYAKLISYVPQMSYSVFPFSVYEIVMMGRTPYLNMLGFEKEADVKAVNEALDRLEIEHLAKKGINEISGGEAQRVFIARALAQDAKIILLDEPNAHLDLEHQITIFELLKKINIEERKTVLTISHDLNLVGIYSNRVVIMEKGTVAADGEKKLILTKENIKNSFRVDADVISRVDDSINVLINPVHK